MLVVAIGSPCAVVDSVDSATAMPVLATGFASLSMLVYVAQCDVSGFLLWIVLELLHLTVLLVCSGSSCMLAPRIIGLALHLRS